MKRRGSAGYTILEVLIVLAVTTTLFLGVVLLLSGRQGQTETTQAVRDFESKIQNIASDVSNGFFPNGYTCTADTAGSPVTVNNPIATPSSVGANVGCISIGKVIVFDTADADILTVVGRQFVSIIGGSDVSTIAETKPVAVARAGGPDVTDNYPYRFGLRVTKMVRLSDNITSVGAVAFMSQLSGGVGASNPTTGSRSTLLYGLSSTTTPNTDPVITTATKVSVTANFYAIPDGVRLCLLGGNGQKAEITIGANGSQTATFVSIDNGVNSVC